MLTNYERETIITFNEGESECECYTYNKKLINKLTVLCERYPDVYKKVSEDEFGGCTFCFHKKKMRIKFTEPMSESRKQEVEKRLAYARSKISSKGSAK